MVGEEDSRQRRRSLESEARERRPASTCGCEWTAETLDGEEEEWTTETVAESDRDGWAAAVMQVVAFTLDLGMSF